jgi:threonine dehydrogenase-like Zn-dependent dehydrogenase
MGIHVNGGFEEYTKVAVNKLVKVNPEISDDVAALGEPFAVGYHVNSHAGVKAGDKVLLAGAGTIGLVVALVARESGAERVIISEINESRLLLARQLGFETINPMKVNILDKMNEVTDGSGFDIAFEASGSKASILQIPDLCRIRGTIVSLGLSGAPCEFILGKISFKEQSVIGSMLYSQEHFEAGIAMMAKLSGKYDLRVLITDIFPLDDTIMAIEKMKAGRSTGKILIKCVAN